MHICMQVAQTLIPSLQAINAVDRGTLNNALLDALERTPNVKLFFNHKLTGADFRTNKAWFERRIPGETPKADSLGIAGRAPEIEVSFDYLIGADGEMSNIAVMRMILRLMGCAEDAFDWVRDRPGHDRRYAIDSSKLRTELGWKPMHTDFEAGLQATIAWYAANRAWWEPAKAATEARYRAQGQ